MNKINQINQKTKDNKDSLHKKVPKSQNTQKNILYETILPNLLHNLEDPQQYLDESRKLSNTSSQGFESAMTFLDKQFMNNLYEQIINDPNFLIKQEEEFTVDEYKNYTNKFFIKIVQCAQFNYEKFKDFKSLVNLFVAAGALNASVGTKIAVHYGLFCKSVANLGTEKHLPLLKRAANLQEMGCFMMTEMAHGSNVQALLTTAHYNHADRTFILNTPHELGMKFWIGNLAKTATFGVCFANLVIDKKNHGIHIFLVRIRNENGDIVPGINLGDCGPKLGIQGVDNGWCLFRRVKIPYDNLLDKYSQIDEQGNFVSAIKSKNQRFALQLSALSGGRLLVGISSSTVGLVSTSIAARYLTVRKQFGKDKFQEQALIEYPVVQDKLFTNFSQSLCYFLFIQDLLNKVEKTDMTEINNINVKELHAQCSWIKGASSDQVIRNIVAMRDLCGGHGYSVYSQYPRLLKDMIVQSTWEGSNGVLIQQTAKFLLTEFSQYIQKGKINVKTFQFLKKFEDDDYLQNVGQQAVLLLEELKTDQWVSNFDQFIQSLKVLFQIRLKNAGELVAENFAIEFEGKKNLFQAFNGTLPLGLIDACTFYGEYEMLLSLERYFQQDMSKNEKEFFIKSTIIFCLKTILEKSVYFEGLISLELLKKINRVLFTIYPQMIHDIVVFADVIIPRDEVIQTTVGVSTGNVYQQIMNRIRADPRNSHTEMIWNRN